MPRRYIQAIALALGVAALTACHAANISNSPPIPPAAEAPSSSNAVPNTGAQDDLQAPAQQNTSPSAHGNHHTSEGPGPGTGVTNTQSVDGSDSCGGFE